MHTNDNLTTERKTFVTHLECSATGEHYPADQIHHLSKAGKPLLVRYDLGGVLNEAAQRAIADKATQVPPGYPTEQQKLALKLQEETLKDRMRRS